MSKRATPELLLTDIVESSEKILRYTLNMSFEEFISNELIIDAVIRNFEVIGEAANRLPDEFKDKYNRIVHDYAGIDFEIVWRIKEAFLPDMLSQIKKIIN